MVKLLIKPEKVAEVDCKTCSHDGCTNLPEQDGVCFRHGAKKATCSHTGCNKWAQEGGSAAQLAATWKVPKKAACRQEDVATKPEGKEREK
jgi:hypothetical protein